MKTTFPRTYKRLLGGGIALVLILLIGTFGYYHLTGKQHSLVDCFYMTFITVATIGYGEIIDLSNNPAGRLFTIVIALFGIGTLTYSISMFTAIVVEGDLQETFTKRKMEKLVRKIEDHFIVCGLGRVGTHIAEQLHSAKRPNLVVDIDEKKIEFVSSNFPNQIYVIGDATDEDVLVEAGIHRAKGLFAATEDDSRNLVICLTAKHLNPKVRVVVRCNEPSHRDKMRKAGADATTLPAHMGGFRMLTEMIRPNTVSFFDSLLKDDESGLHIEEMRVTEKISGNIISALNLQNFPNTILLAMKKNNTIIYKPLPDTVLENDCVLLFLTTAEECKKLESNA
jgi:voltage-gated potassium channel